MLYKLLCPGPGDRADFEWNLRYEIWLGTLAGPPEEDIFEDSIFTPEFCQGIVDVRQELDIGEKI